MEMWVFVGLVIVVGIVLAVRTRRGGTGTRIYGRSADKDESIAYGARVSPPGTPPGATVNTGWFNRDHTDAGRNDDAAE